MNVIVFAVTFGKLYVPFKFVIFTVSPDTILFGINAKVGLIFVLPSYTFDVPVNVPVKVRDVIVNVPAW